MVENMAYKVAGRLEALKKNHYYSSMDFLKQCINGVKYMIKYYPDPSIKCYPEKHFQVGAGQGICNIAFHGKDFLAQGVGTDQLQVISTHALTDRALVQWVAYTMAFLMSLLSLNLCRLADVTVWTDVKWQSITIVQKRKKRTLESINVADVLDHDFFLPMDMKQLILDRGIFERVKMDVDSDCEMDIDESDGYTHTTSDYSESNN